MHSVHSLQAEKFARDKFWLHRLLLWQGSTEYSQIHHLSTITLGKICKLSCHKEQSRTPPDFTA